MIAAAPTLRAAVSLTESEIIEGCKLGQRDAQAALYRTYRPHVMRIVYRVLGPHRDLVEDVLQDVFIVVFRSILNFRGDSRLSTWLYRVSVNVALQWLSRRHRSRELTGGSDDDDGRTMPAMIDERTPQRSCEVSERMRAVYRALDQLSEKKRVVFVLHEIEQLEPREIAGVLGINVMTVRTRLHYARKEFFAVVSRSPDFDAEPALGQAA